MEHFRVDAPMDDLAGPPLRRPICVDELLTAEGGDGHTGALLERGLFVARVGLGREEDGQIVRVRNRCRLSPSSCHEEPFALTDP